MAIFLSVYKQSKFDKMECRSCIYKSSSYCWNQCSFNTWKIQVF